MVSKPNPDADAEIRKRMYDSYYKQISAMNYPGNFAIGNATPFTNDEPYYNRNMTMNENSAFKLGSGAHSSFNAYDAPNPFFYVETRGGSKRKKPSTKDIEYQDTKKEAEVTWSDLVSKLIPLGFELVDIASLFYSKYSDKYGGDVVNSIIENKTKDFINSARQLGNNQYLYNL